MTAVDDSLGLDTVAGRVGAEVAAPAAGEVDRDARFPAEAMDALRQAGLLSALVPADEGGGGAGIFEVAGAVRALAHHCASTAMVFAMHQIQVACLVRHGRAAAHHQLRRRLVDEQLLFASATTEAAVGGDVRTSLCAVERDGDRIHLEKQAPVISYGDHADAVFATARQGPESATSDQVLVVCHPPGLVLQPTSGWDTLGFRGTCSLGYRLVADGTGDDILSDPYGLISAETMLPVSHLLWTSLWLGLAEEAAERAHHYVRGKARATPGVTPPSALRLAELAGQLESLRTVVTASLRRYERVQDDEAELARMGLAISMNTLKVQASSLLVDIVGRAMTICGMAGYRLDSPASMGRLLRDAYGAVVMISNDRILANNATLLTAAKEL